MKKFVPYIIVFSLFLPITTKAQFEVFKDSVVQLYGIVMTADSLKGLESVSIMIKGQNRGTITNGKGVFSIVVLKGDVIDFTSIGFKPKSIVIPSTLEGNQHSIIQLMVNDTIYLAATIIKSRPTRAQFERDFINLEIPDDYITIARKNTNEASRRMLMATLPTDGRENANMYLRKASQKAYYAGQVAPQNIFNPFAWAEFIKAWKRGDYKSKK